MHYYQLSEVLLINVKIFLRSQVLDMIGRFHKNNKHYLIQFYSHSIQLIMLMQVIYYKDIRNFIFNTP